MGSLHQVPIVLAQNEADFAAIGAIILVAMVVGAVLGILYGVSLMKVFDKAGIEPWRAWVPFYSAMTRAEISGRNPVWGLHSLVILIGWIPILGFLAGIGSLVVNVIISIDTAKSFGRSSAFGVGIAFLGFIFMPILAFGDDRYLGPAGPDGRPGWTGPGQLGSGQGVYGQGGYGQGGYGQGYPGQPGHGQGGHGHGGYQPPAGEQWGQPPAGQQWGQPPADQWGQPQPPPQPPQQGGWDQPPPQQGWGPPPAP